MAINMAYKFQTYIHYKAPHALQWGYSLPWKHVLPYLYLMRIALYMSNKHVYQFEVNQCKIYD